MKKSVLLCCFLALVLFVSTPAPASAAAAKTKIVIGQSIALTGPIAPQPASQEIPLINLWLQEVKKKGGIYVPEYGKRLPVELLRYDDKSDIPTTINLFTKLATVDKVDIIFPPHGTAFHWAVLPLAAKYKYPLVTWTFMTERFREVAAKYPWTFVTTTASRESQDALLALMLELGVKKAAIIYPAVEFGIENAQCLAPKMGPAGIDVAIFKSYPFPPKDLSPLIEEAKAANVDAFIAFSYVPDTMMLPEQAKIANFNPKLFYVALGAAWPQFKEKFGAGVEGVMGPGGWNEKVSPQAKEFSDKFLAMAGRRPDNWSMAFGYGTYQIYEQAIEKVGLNRQKLRDYIATATFQTVYGPIKYTDNFNLDHISYIGQWQNGTFESVNPSKNRKVKPIYPKPPWP
ncbi:MAG TPA: amino acid ABC transporter substrate-binding protein [Syntrophorhabdales bacterium]|nr:amino acid ABC transporter substrate-binding protein [Syntrophorhabdales bacterium]